MGHYANLAAYIGCSVAFVIAIVYMFVYNTRLKTRNKSGGTEAGIAAATEKKEHKGHTGPMA